MRWSLRFQFLGPLALLMLGVAAAGLLAAYSATVAAEKRIARQVNGIVATLADSRYPLTLHVLDQVKGLSGAEFLLVGPQDEWTATIPSRAEGLPRARDPDFRESPNLGDRIVIDQRAYLARGILLRAPHLNAGSRLYVLYPEALRDEAMQQAARPVLLFGAVAGVAAVVLSLYTSQGVVRRIRELERGTRAIAAGDFSPMPLPRRHDELRDLAQSVNEMASRLAVAQQAIARSERTRLLGQLSAGLAHQFRNAVTGAKLALQVHADSCPGGDREALNVADRQLARISADLQRIFEYGDERPADQSCRVAEIVSESVALVAPQCRHAGIELAWNPPTEAIVVRGDAGHLGHMIQNLITNAIEAAGPGGRVWVDLSVQLSRCILNVSDNGPGPASEVASHVFEPFVTGKPEGIGLGLAVARQIAQTHGGRIDWRRDGSRTIFSVDLPLQ